MKKNQYTYETTKFLTLLSHYMFNTGEPITGHGTTQDFGGCSDELLAKLTFQEIQLKALCENIA